MDIQASSTSEVRITLSGAEAEQLSSLAAQAGVSPAQIIRHAIEQFMASTELDEIDWQAAGLSTFEASWDNTDDAIYDQWREHYGVGTR